MTDKKIKVIVICGATASGKSAVGMRLAQLLSGEIVSADSMQIYKHMDIGTAKPTAEEQQLVKHHLIDILQPSEESSVYLYTALAEKAIEDICLRGKIPILVGGTGLYINTLLSGTVLTTENKDETYRKYLNELAEEKGVDFVHLMLKKIDPQSAEDIHPNNVKRVIRALEIYKQSGITKTQTDELSRKEPSKYEPMYIRLDIEREMLYNNINKRVDIMITNGLLDECKGLDYHSMSITAKAGIGYKELFEHIYGTTSLDECIEQIKTNSRKYAKRQITWFKRLNDAYTVNKEQDIEKLVNVIKEFLYE